MTKQSYVIAAIIGLSIAIVLVVVAVRVASHGSDSSPVATPSASAAPLHVQVYALFEDDGLTACAEIIGRDLGDAGAFDNDSFVRINQRCDQAFADRPVLATCTVHGRSTAPVDGSSTAIHYYDALGLENDVEMRDCLKNAGAWQALSRDDDAYRRSRLRGHAKELQHIGERLSKEYGR